MRSIVIVLAALAAGHVHAEPQPIIDDERSHGPIAHHLVEIAASNAWLSSPGDVDNLRLSTLQVGVGPAALQGKLWEIAGGLSSWALRLRTTYVDIDQNVDGKRDGFGPLTLAAVHYAPLGPLDLAPLVYIQTGVDAAVSTPWLSGSHRLPVAALRDTDLVPDLSENGWSLRPFSPYFRADLLVCRSVYIELGAAPEVFVPTAGNTAHEYDLRWHASTGISAACSNQRDSFFHHLAIAAFYSARARLYASDADPDYRQNLTGMLQYDVGPVVLAVLATFDPEVTARYHMIGVRVQLGAGERR